MASARAAAARMSLSDYLAPRLVELADEPTLDEVLDRLESRPVRGLGITAAGLRDEARAE